MKSLKLYDRRNWNNDDIRETIESLQETLQDRQNNEYTLGDRDLEDMVGIQYHWLCGIQLSWDVPLNIDVKVIQSIIDSDYQIATPTIIISQVFLKNDLDKLLLDANDSKVKYRITNAVTVTAIDEDMYYVKSEIIELDLTDEYALPYDTLRAEYYLTKSDLGLFLKTVLIERDKYPAYCHGG